MPRSLLLAALLALPLAALAPTTARAQNSQIEAGSPEYEAELGDIETRADWATALYVEGTLSTLLGLGGGTFGFICCGAGFGILMGGVGYAVALIGGVSLGVAIGLDVGSGARRDALEARTRRALRLDLGPGTAAFELELDDASAALRF